jgi:glutamyl-tRNA synthetase
MENKRVRTRFAPSPTGLLHIGGVRTALYSYLFAKKHGGDFILRIEDTDQARTVPGATDYIVEALEWCGIIPDEGPGYGGNYGPYIQSERKIYEDIAEQLVASGHAYYAFDTTEELDQARAITGPKWQYNSFTRENLKNSLTLPNDEVQARLLTEPYVIRIKMPRNTDIRFYDEIRGWVVVNSNNVDDKVLMKSNGIPAYHLANVVDDHFMEITHVIRGEEWLPSAPLHVYLYEILGWDLPKFAHLPLIMGPEKGKLSKRDGDKYGFPVFPLAGVTIDSDGDKSFVSGYKEEGYFVEAFINMLAFLGWSPVGDKEIYSMDELIEEFTFERVHKAGAKFDKKKMLWFQKQYFDKKTDEELISLLDGFERVLGPYLLSYVKLTRERATFVGDMIRDGLYLWKAPNLCIDFEPDTHNTLNRLRDILASKNLIDGTEFMEAVKEFVVSDGIKLIAVLKPLRLIITGVESGPSMADIVDFIGISETYKRLGI